MQKPSFGVVTGVVTILAIIAFLSQPLIGLVPQGPENSLASEKPAFLRQGSREEIDWHTADDETFADARKQDKPIMLVVGSACSPTGRFMDRVVLNGEQIRGILARNFVCVRADAMARPDLMNAFLPISRAAAGKNGRLGIPPDFQVWFLDPKGRLYDFAAQTLQAVSFDARTFTPALENAADMLEQIQKRGGTPGRIQEQDLAAIAGPLVQQLPDLSAAAGDLAVSIGPTNGGFPVNGFQRLWPSAWQLELLGQRFDDYSRSIAPCLSSPEVDLLDGGFFTDAASLDWKMVGYDKLAVTNAAMLQTLSMGSVLMNDPLQRWLAFRTFDCLTRDFAQDGFLAAGQIGDEGVLQRSVRDSFSPRKLRAMFPDDGDREWLRQNLGLRVETNPLMTPRLSKPSEPVLDAKKLESMLARLSKDRASPRYAGLAQLDVGGFSVARMLVAARLLGDKVRTAKARDLYQKLDQFRSLDDVVHSQAPDAAPASYLSDYLGYADASLQYFLVSGDPTAFKNGLAVLRRGLFLFNTGTRGVFCLSQPPTTRLGPQDATSPEIVDNNRESCTAQVIRLCNDYGRLLGAAGADLNRVAGDTLNRFAPIAPALGQYAAGYFCAAAQTQNSSYALATGPDAVALANSLAVLAPGSLVAPALGPIAAPGSSRGVYIIRAGIVAGPLSISEAANQLKSPPF